MPAFRYKLLCLLTSKELGWRIHDMVQRGRYYFLWYKELVIMTLHLIAKPKDKHPPSSPKRGVGGGGRVGKNQMKSTLPLWEYFLVKVLSI